MTRHTTHIPGCDCYIHKKEFKDAVLAEYNRLEELIDDIKADKFLPEASKKWYINFICGVQSRLYGLQDGR